MHLLIPGDFMQAENKVAYEQKFRLYEYYFREYLTERFYLNVFMFCCFAQFVLASAFMINVATNRTAIFIFMVLTAYMFVYNPSGKGSAARLQSSLYERLLHHFEECTLEGVAHRISMLAITDSSVPEPLVRPAYLLAYRAIHGRSEEAERFGRSLSRPERLYALIAGRVF